MKNVNQLITICVLLIVTKTLTASPYDNKNHFKNLKKVSLKCDVLYVGGERGIHFHYDLPVNLRDTFEIDLKNIKNPSKNKIYRVNECVDINKKFTDDIANSLDKESQLNG